MTRTGRAWMVLATLAFLVGLLALISAPRLRAGSFTCDGERVTILGTGGDDILDGTGGPDVIAGLGGNDRIRGFGGDDTLCGGDGDDVIDGGSGTNFIDGGAGTNSCTDESTGTKNCDARHRIQGSPDPEWAGGSYSGGSESGGSDSGESDSPPPNSGGARPSVT